MEGRSGKISALCRGAMAEATHGACMLAAAT